MNTGLVSSLRADSQIVRKINQHTLLTIPFTFVHKWPGYLTIPGLSNDKVSTRKLQLIKISKRAFQAILNQPGFVKQSQQKTTESSTHNTSTAFRTDDQVSVNLSSRPLSTADSEQSSSLQEPVPNETRRRPTNLGFDPGTSVSTQDGNQAVVNANGTLTQLEFQGSPGGFSAWHNSGQSSEKKQKANTDQAALEKKRSTDREIAEIQDQIRQRRLQSARLRSEVFQNRDQLNSGMGGTSRSTFIPTSTKKNWNGF